jgi:hypothetical protein
MVRIQLSWELGADFNPLIIYEKMVVGLAA